MRELHSLWVHNGDEAICQICRWSSGGVRELHTTRVGRYVTEGMEWFEGGLHSDESTTSRLGRPVHTNNKRKQNYTSATCCLTMVFL